MKKVISTTIILSLLLSLFTFTVSANETVDVLINKSINFEYLGDPFIPYDKTIKSIVYPITYKDRTYIPARFLAEAIGFEVTWDEATQTVGFIKSSKPATSFETEHKDRISYNDTAILNKNIKFTVNGVPFVPTEADGSICYPLTYKDRTYIPARFIAEQAGLFVGWNGETQTISLDYFDPAEEPDDEEELIVVPKPPVDIPSVPDTPTETPVVDNTMFANATEATKILVLGATVTEDGQINNNTASIFPDFSSLIDEKYGINTSEENNISISGTTLDLTSDSKLTIIFNVKNVADFENYLKSSFTKIRAGAKGFAMPVGNSLGCTIEINKTMKTVIYSLGAVEWQSFLMQ